MPAPLKSNLELLRQRRENAAAGDFKFWKPKDDGKYIIRFLPPASEEDMFYEETAQYKLGEKYFYAPHAKKQPDPIYEYYRALWKKGTPEAEALAREIKPVKKFLYNIIVREELGKASENPTKVFVYMSGVQLNQKICDYMFDPDYGDLTDTEAGYDFIITKTTDGQFPNYDQSKPRKNPSPLFDDQDMIEETLKQVKDLAAEVEYCTYDQLKEELALYLKNRNGEDGPVAASTTARPAASSPKAAAPAASEDMNDYEKDLLSKLDD